MSSGGKKVLEGRDSGKGLEAAVHDVSDLSELDDFTGELERALAEAGGSGEPRQREVERSKGGGSKVWGRF